MYDDIGAVRAAATSLRTFAWSTDRRVRHRTRFARVVSYLAVFLSLPLGLASFAYLVDNSNLNESTSLLVGFLTSAPLALVPFRPLLAWRLAFLTGILGGIPVQAHHRTPFSWHPALLVAQFVILVVLASRHRFAVTVCAWLTMAVLVTVSFFPADRVPLMEIVGVLMGIGCLVRGRPYRRLSPQDRPGVRPSTR